MPARLFFSVPNQTSQIKMGGSCSSRPSAVPKSQIKNRNQNRSRPAADREIEETKL
jgi:hypothetical protein